MPRKLTAALIAAAALALLAPAGALARTFAVDVGPPGRLPAHLDFDAFFPSALTVHAGDSVRFEIMGFHDVAYLPPGMARPPLAIPAPGAATGDLRDAAGAPFWFDPAPGLELNPLVALRAGGGTLAPARYATSGLPSRSQLTSTYLLRFTRPGTYRMYCLVHGAMSMLVRVVPQDRSIPSPAQAQATAHAQLQAALRLAQRLDRFTPPRLTVLAGHDAGPVAWMRFFPEHLRIRVGQTVTFRIDSTTSRTPSPSGPTPTPERSSAP
jgi:plastocyanin